MSINSSLVVASGGSSHLFMFDVISSTLDRLVPWTGIERSDSYHAQLPSGQVRVETGDRPDIIAANYLSNTIITDTLA